MRIHGVAFLLLLAAGPATAASPAGTKIVAPDGEPDDRFGREVAALDDGVAVSATYDVHGGARGGSISVFRRDGSAWTGSAKLAPDDLQTLDQFGYAIDADEGVMAASAAGNPRRGAVWVFRRDGDEWKQEQKLVSPDGEGDHFGIDVAITGDVLVAGAYLSGHPKLNHPGAAHVFRRRDGAWAHEQKLVADAPDSVDHFGLYVAAEGDVIAVGAQYDDDGGKNAGAVYVFRFDGKTWVQEQKLVPSDAASFDWFGTSVAVSGDRIAVGARGGDDGAGEAGVAYVFRREADTWREEQKVTAPKPAQNDNFGVSLDLRGDRLLVGAEEAGPGDAGRAYLFERRGDRWALAAELAPKDVAEGKPWFGHAVALGEDVAWVGAPKAESAFAFPLGSGAAPAADAPAAR